MIYRFVFMGQSTLEKNFLGQSKFRNITFGKLNFGEEVDEFNQGFS